MIHMQLFLVQISRATASVVLLCACLVSAGTPSPLQAQSDGPVTQADDLSKSNTDETGGGRKSAADRKKSADKTEEEPPPSLLTFVAPKEIEMLIGLRVTSGDGNMLSTTAMTVFPTDWPEQKVEVLEVNMPAMLKSDFRDLPNNNRQLMFFSQVIPGNSNIEGTVRVRITKSHIVGPEETTNLKIPRRVAREMKPFTGNSPYIEADSADIRKVVKEIDATEPLTDWKRVEQLYDWVRENITYENGELKTVRDAMRDRSGDCEEMTSIFVALCRASRVPARVVWIPNHCYPEFYLEDENGNGHWFPCQVAGTRNFGSMPEYLPILQKGDRFKVPEKQEVQRYLADYLSSKKVLGRTDPKVEFIREMLGDAAQLKAPDLGGEANKQPAADE